MFQNCDMYYLAEQTLSRSMFSHQWTQYCFDPLRRKDEVFDVIRMSLMENLLHEFCRKIDKIDHTQNCVMRASKNNQKEC